MPNPKIKKLKAFALQSLCLLCATAAVSAADTLSLAPVADGFLRSTQSAQQNRNTTNRLYLVGNTAQRGDIMRGVLAFDLNAPELKGAKITGAQLVVPVLDRDLSGGGSVSQDKEVSAHLLANGFDEATAEWLRSKSGTPWATPGGDFGPALATIVVNPATVVGGQQLTFASPELTAAVQAAEGNTVNLLVKLNVEDNQRSILRLQSGAARLKIDYEPTPEVAAANAVANLWRVAPEGAVAEPAKGVSPLAGNIQDEDSQIYVLNAGGHNVPVKAGRYSFDVAMFTMSDAPVQVDVMLKDDFSSFTLKPDRHGIKTERIGNALRFTLDQPHKLVLQVPGRTPLAILVTPTETEIPDRADPNVVYFEPGVTTAGTIRPKSGQTFYLAPGAVVRGRIEAKGVKNVRVIGRGILDVSNHSVQGNKHPGVLFEDSENILIDGIGIRSYNGWWQTLFVNSTDIVVSQVNIFGIGVNTDGVDIDAVKNFLVRDSFIRAEDDGLGWHSLDAAIYGEMITENAVADNIVIWNTTAGNGIRIGASMEGQLWRDIIIRNVDILMHAGAGIYSDYSDWAWTSNLRFEDIVIEKASNPINFYIAKTRYSNLTNYLDERGNVDRLLFERVTMNGGRIRLAGAGEAHQISVVRFNDSTNAGQPLTSVSQLDVNAYVTDIAFNEPLPPLPAAPAGVIDLTFLESASKDAAQYIARKPEAPLGRSRVLAATKPGASYTHTLSPETAGEYTASLTIFASPDGGVADLSIDGKTVAEAVDFYAASPQLKTVELGELSIAKDTASQLQLTVTGKSEQSAGYRLEVATLSLEPR